MPDKGKRNFSDFIEAFSKTPSLAQVPEEFRRWTAISLISGALGRKTWLPAFRFAVRPNLYIGLIGAPGTYKSTSIRRGYDDIFGKLSETINGTEELRSQEASTYQKYIRESSPFKMYTGSVTSVQLGKMMSRIRNDTTMLPANLDSDFYNDSSMSLVTYEFGRLMGGLSRDNELAIMLTDAWDAGRIEHETATSTRYKIQGVYLNWLFGATPDEFRERMPANAIDQGLLSRILPIYYGGEGARPDLLGEPTADERLEDLRRDLGVIGGMAGEFRWESESLARETAEWIAGGMEPRPTAYELRGYMERRHVHFTKTLLCVSASRTSERVITASDVSDTKAWIIQAEKNMPFALQGFGASDFGKIANQVKDWLRSRPRHTVSAVELKSHCMKLARNAQEVNELITMMKEAEMLESSDRGKVTMYRLKE